MGVPYLHLQMVWDQVYFKYPSQQVLGKLLQAHLWHPNVRILGMSQG